jgi:hypothetical protein
VVAKKVDRKPKGAGQKPKGQSNSQRAEWQLKGSETGNSKKVFLFFSGLLHCGANNLHFLQISKEEPFCTGEPLLVFPALENHAKYHAS